MIINLKAHIAADGTVTLKSPPILPAGEVDIMISYLTDEERADEALWDAQFAATPIAVFEALIAEGRAEIESGQTEDFDPSIEDG